MNLFYFDKFLLLYLYFLIDISDCEDPLSKCTVNQPFRLIDSNCGSFEEVCVKKGDQLCDNVINACQQCPSTNYTLPMLMNILKSMKTEISVIKLNQTDYIKTIKAEIYKIKLNQIAEIKTIKDQLNNQSMKSQYKIDHILGLMIFLVVIIVVVLITLIVIEVKFKIITKGIQRLKKKTLTRNNNRNNVEIECNNGNGYTASLTKPNEGNEGTRLLTTDGQNIHDHCQLNVEKQLNDGLVRIASEINMNTDSKIADVLKLVKEQLNDHLERISSEIKSIKSNSDIPKENKESFTMELEERDKQHELESTPNTENIVMKPIIESDGNPQEISNEVNGGISEEAGTNNKDNDNVLGYNHHKE